MITKYTLESTKWLRDRGWATDDEVLGLEWKYQLAKLDYEEWLRWDIGIDEPEGKGFSYPIKKLLKFDKSQHPICPFYTKKVHNVIIYPDNNFYCPQCQKGAGPVTLFRYQTNATQADAVKALSR